MGCSLSRKANKTPVIMHSRFPTLNPRASIYLDT
jgi:hypothetical protein